MAICWERAVLLAFRLCCSASCRPNCFCPFHVWYLGQDMEFDCIGRFLLVHFYVDSFNDISTLTTIVALTENTLCTTLCLCKCRIHHIRLYFHFIASRYKRRLPEMDFPVTNQEWSIALFVLAWRRFFWPAYVKDIFLSYAEAKTIMFSHQNKENPKQSICWKHLNIQRAICLQILKKKKKKGVFPLLLRYRLKTVFLIGISWITLLFLRV